MKRIRIAVIAMLVIIAASVGLYFAASHVKTKNDNKAAQEEDKLTIFSFDENASTNLSIHNESGNYEMTFTQADGWTMVNDVNFEVNSNTAVNICTAMASLKAERIIEDTDTAKYGFGANMIDLTVTANGTDYTLHVGDPTPTNEYFYVMKEGSDSIYLIDYTTGMTLCATKDALKSLYIADYNSSDVNHFALWKGSETDENILFSMNMDENGKWYMDKPYKDDTVYSSDVSTFVNDAIRDKVYKFVAENCPESDYAKYGFDKPQYVFEISAGDKYTKVIFGNYINNDTEMYGLFTENGQVVTFEKGTVTILGYDTADMMNKYVYSQKLSDISSVKLTTPDGSCELGIDSENSKYTFNGTEISSDDNETGEIYMALIDSFNKVYFESIDKDAVPEGDPEITVEYTLTDGTDVKLEYIPVPGEDSNKYWAVKDGEYTGFIIRKKVIANITSVYDALAETVK